MKLELKSQLLGWLKWAALFIRAKQGTKTKDGSQALLSAEARGKFSRNENAPMQGLGVKLVEECRIGAQGLVTDILSWDSCEMSMLGKWTQVT